MNFTGKVVIDATNPLDMSGMPPRLVGGLGTSAGELIQQAVPDAFVVKAFNSVGNAQFHRPQFAGGPPDMFLCGDDANAKAVVAKLLDQFGFDTVDAGPLKEGWRIQRDTPGYGPRRTAEELRKDLAAARRYVILGIVIFAAVATPGGDLVSWAALTLTMYGLFEVTVWFIRRTGH